MEKFRRRSAADKRHSRSYRASSGLNGLTIDGKGSISSSVTNIDVDVSNGDQGFKGPLGLNLLHSVPEPRVDFIFIHGLGGGSRKTWSKSPDPYHYWPKEWLSRDPEFSCARVHSFGYKADWAERNPNFLNTHDFSLALLGEIQCSPEIRRSNTKIVFVAHSMGGIVTKKACILSQEDPALAEIASRIHTIYFLATPHRGSNLARTLHNICKVTFGQKHFVEELYRDSSSLQLVDDDFRAVSHNIQIFSFYETLPCRLGFMNVLIVEKESATTGHPNERSLLSNADHRTICKFDNPTDVNYRSLRNAFVTTMDFILAESHSETSDSYKDDYSNLIALTSVSEAPIDDLLALQELQTPGTCEWLSQRQCYTVWKLASLLDKRAFWLTGDAGCGKSILASYVVTDLEKSNLNCSYYFFQRNNADKSSTADCILSLAFQIGQRDKTLCRYLSQLFQRTQTSDKVDEKALWRAVFLETIFKHMGHESHYWVIDGVDECRDPPLLLSLLYQAPPHLRIFMTSRNIPGVYRVMAPHAETIEHYFVQDEDTAVDLRLYIQSKTNFFPRGSNGDQRGLEAKVLETANGSFLWTSLVVRELEDVYSEEAADEVLSKIPAGMEGIYIQMLESVSPQRTRLAQPIFTWTLLAKRTLSIDELKYAIKGEIGETIHNLADAIMPICGQFIQVDKNGYVQCIHQTAKSFLLGQSALPSLTIDKVRGHSKIAQLCLQTLNRTLSTRSGGKPKGAASVANLESDMTDYSAIYYSDHLRESGLEDDTVWTLLTKFLRENVFSWVEYLARTGRLQHLGRAAENLRAQLRDRLSRNNAMLQGSDFLAGWIHDLMRLGTGFRGVLSVHPHSIHTVVPALCPSQSMIYKAYAARPRGLIVKGAADKTWGGCTMGIEHRDMQACAVAHGSRYLAVAFTNGNILLYLHNSSKIHNRLEHGERVRLLLLSNNDRYLASSGLRRISVWDLDRGTQKWSLNSERQALSLAFANENSRLVAATQGGYTASWSLQDEAMEEEIWHWTDTFQEATGQPKPFQPPSKALISEDCFVLAVSYRGKRVHLFDMNAGTMLGTCNRFAPGVTGPEYAVDALAFGLITDREALVVSYGDGELVLYDRWTTELICRTRDVFAHTLACSPDGRRVIAGSARGTIKIYELCDGESANMTLVSRINTSDEGIRGVTFGHDSLRFAYVRGSQCRVWEPSTLIQTKSDKGDETKLGHAGNLASESVYIVESVLEPEVTAICAHPSGNHLFYGKEDGSVTCFDIPSATQQGVLYHHAHNIRITCMVYCQRRGLLITADEASRVLVVTISCTPSGCNFLATVAGFRCNYPVLSLLANESGTRISAKGRDFSRVWTTSGCETDSRITLNKSGDKHTVLNHPFEVNTFIVVGPSHTAAHSWHDDSGHVDTSCNANIADKRDQPIGKSDPSNNAFPTWAKSQSKFIATFEQATEISVATFKIWDSTQIRAAEEWPQVITLPGFEHVSVNMRQIIYTVGSLVIFLTNDLWVCSVDITQWIAHKQGAKRHFILLSDWKNSMDHFLIEYIPMRREFAVVRKHDILVIRRGLDVGTLLD